jgi:heme/copper-type cytochrome/quinol oxidase subunit 2
MNLQLASAMVLATDVVKVFNPQSPPAREILDLAIVVIAVMVVIFAVIVGIAREDCGTASCQRQRRHRSWVFFS